VSNASHNLDTALSLLRGLLRFGGKESLLTTHHQGTTTIYQLSPQHLLWADVDEFLSLVTLAEQVEEQGGDPLPTFEAAWQIGSQVFLEDDVYCEWAQARYQTVNMTRHRVLHRLADLYMQRNQPHSAEKLLLKALEEEPTDEDNVCRLMALLEQQGRRQEALRCYERLVTVLKEECETEPLPSTQALAERLQAVSLTPQCSCPSTPPLEVEVDILVSAIPHGVPGPALFTVTLPLTARNVSQQLSFAVGEQDSSTFAPGGHDSLLRISQETLSNDLLYRIIKEICYWTGREDFQYTLQMSIDRLIKEFDTMEQQRSPGAGQLSRRDALMVIAGLPLTLLVKIQTGSMAPALLEEFLAQCTASIAICWHLLKGTEFQPVEAVLSRYLPVLDKLAYQPSRYQKSIASLAAQGHILAATLTLHQNNLLAREAHCKQAIQLGQLAEDVNLHMTALKWLAVTYYYAKSPFKALQAYQKIEPFIDHISPLLRGSVYIKMAGAYAQCGREPEALRYIRMAHEHFPENPEQDPCFLYADCGLQSLPLWEGLTYLDLGQPREAQSALERVEKLPTIIVSERGRIEAINHQAEAALALGDQERFRAYIEMGVRGAKALGSEKRYNEAFDVYQQAKKLWRNEPGVKELRDLFGS
jgi:tetratricopeptide (TPR) repeat protein